MESCSRFSDNGYKNWLKTTMSLQLLRRSLCRFVENETETFYGALRSHAGGAQCQSRCDVKTMANKVPSICKVCLLWRDEILANHNNKNGKIYWNNCSPSKWSSDKWEVAKVYMPGGNKTHCQIDQFDVSALLNFMNFCKHFQKFVKKQALTEVISVRNHMMHSAEMKVEKEEMEGHVVKILQLAKQLQDYIPEMEALQQDIAQLQKAELSISMNSVDSTCTNAQESIIQKVLDMQNIQDMEQQILKEKIEFLACCVKEGQNTKTEIEGMREFLHQNKDLLETLSPQIEQLNEIQQKVEQHDQQLSVLTVKVDKLEQNSHEPGFSVDAPRFKNHLLEMATKNQWPLPVFSVIFEAKGYKGQVVVNGQTFTGLRIHGSIKASHQEVSKLALEQLSAEATVRPEGSGSLQPDSLPGAQYFSSVTVSLDINISSSEGQCEKEKAIESAYKNLATKFGTEVSNIASSIGYKLAVQQSLVKCGFRQPEEFFSSDADEKICCNLKLSDTLNFPGQEGSTKRRLAEQQAAKVALLKLSGVFGKKVVSGDNYKGALKELLEAKGLTPPVYTDIPATEPLVAEVGPSPCHGVSALQNELPQHLPVEITEDLQDMARGQSSMYVSPSQQRPGGQTLKLDPPASLVSLVQDSEGHVSQSSHAGATGEAAHQLNIPDVPSHTVGRSVSTGANGQFYAAVKVPVKRVLDGPEAETKEDAIRGAYTPLAESFGLGDPVSASPTCNIRQLVLDFFSKDQCRCVEDCGTTAEGKFSCKLNICGDFTFQNPEGTSKKQQAEQGAAKEALTRLARVLDWDLSGINGNYKGRLQELLAKQGEKPSYENMGRPGDAEPSGQSTAEPAPGNVSAGDTLSASAKNKAVPSVQSDEPSPPMKILKTDETECICREQIEMTLQISGFQPPYVTVEDIISTIQFVYKLEIHLADYMFRNPEGFASKKGAMHNTYLRFGLALGICNPSTAQNESVSLVQAYFKQRCLNSPLVDVTQDKDKFFASLKVTSFSCSYEGKGPTEERAKQEASVQALTQLVPLFGALNQDRIDDAEHRLGLMLKNACQREPSFQYISTQHRVSAKLFFSDFTVESKDPSKKSARIKLCARILGLLGDKDNENSIGALARNRVDDWFKKQGLSQPVFADTNDGAKSTFTVTLPFSHPEWEASVYAATKKLVEEMMKRLRHLTEDDTRLLV